MRTVQISDRVRDVIDRHVAEGAAVTEADFVEAAVRRYAEELDDETHALLAAAEEGIEAIRRGDYVTISSRRTRRHYGSGCGLAP